MQHPRIVSERIDAVTWRGCPPRVYTELVSVWGDWCFQFKILIIFTETHQQNSLKFGRDV